MSAPALIGLDWGTSSLRAYLIDAVGRIVERREADAGILRTTEGDHAGVLTRHIGDWLAAHRAVPVLAAGMIGSRQGWVEIPYLNCPAGAGDLAGGMLAQDFAAGRYIHFVPGLAIRNGEVPDVMRGEETQIIGAGSRDEGERLYVLPGSHSKWALVRTDRIVWFATFMTGEVFAALRGHTILGRTMEGEAVDGDAFARGVAVGRDEDAVNGGLLRRLFGARTLALFDELAIADGPSYLSGLLIGAELREALAALPVDRGAPATLTIVGRSDLAGLYRSALTRAGLMPALAPDDAAATGLWRIARAAGLIGEG